MFWLAEDDCGAAQSAASRSLQSGLDLYLRLRGLQLGAHAKSGGHSFGGVGRGRRVSAWAGFSPIGPRNIRNQLLATTRDEKQQAKHRIPQFFSSLLGKRNGLWLNSMRRRPLVENRRYLPPPGRKTSGPLLRSRMREEAVLV